MRKISLGPKRIGEPPAHKIHVFVGSGARTKLYSNGFPQPSNCTAKFGITIMLIGCKARITSGTRGSSGLIGSTSFVKDECSMAKQAPAICRLSAGVRPSLGGLEMKMAPRSEEH